MLADRYEIIRCLITYNDCWQPSTGSVMVVGAAKADKTIGDGLNPGVVETLEERIELCRRMERLSERERLVLFLWYVRQLHIDDIADEIGVSRRQCFRVKSRALRLLDSAEDERPAA